MTITSGPPEAAAGLSAVAITVTGGDGRQAASLQFDVVFDPTTCSVYSVDPDAAAWDAAKEVMCGPLDDGVVRVIVAGMNQNAIPDGRVATVFLSASDEAAVQSSVYLDRIMVSDPFGVEVESIYENLTALGASAGKDADLNAASPETTGQEDEGSKGASRKTDGTDSPARLAATPQHERTVAGNGRHESAAGAVQGEVRTASVSRRPGPSLSRLARPGPPTADGGRSRGVRIEAQREPPVSSSASGRTTPVPQPQRAESSASGTRGHVRYAAAAPISRGTRDGIKQNTIIPGSGALPQEPPARPWPERGVVRFLAAVVPLGALLFAVRRAFLAKFGGY